MLSKMRTLNCSDENTEGDVSDGTGEDQLYSDSMNTIDEVQVKISYVQILCICIKVNTIYEVSENTEGIG